MLQILQLKLSLIVLAVVLLVTDRSQSDSHDNSDSNKLDCSMTRYKITSDSIVCSDKVTTVQ